MLDLARLNEATEDAASLLAVLERLLLRLELQLERLQIGELLLEVGGLHLGLLALELHFFGGAPTLRARPSGSCADATDYDLGGIAWCCLDSVRKSGFGLLRSRCSTSPVHHGHNADSQPASLRRIGRWDGGSFFL